MALDERQGQIREGAGLEESRLNTEFIDFLRRFGTPIVMIAAVAALSWAGWQRWTMAKANTVNEAWTEFEAARSSPNPSPESLRAVADAYEGVGSVSLMARLDAADAYLRIVRSGVKPGVTLKPDGTVEKPEDLLSAAERESNLAQAEALYQQVAEIASKSTDKTLSTIGALYGLAAVAESREQFEPARLRYVEVITLAKDGPFDTHATVAQQRIDSLDKVKNLPRIYTKAEIPELPPLTPPVAPEGEVAPGTVSTTVLPAADNPDAPVTDGEPATAPDDGATNEAPVPAPTPAPAPVPAPDAPKEEPAPK